MLTVSSQVLAAMFQHDLKESQSRVVEVVDILPDVFEQVLQYLYTGKVKEMDKLAVDLLEAADKYQIDTLKKECGLSLAENLAVDNAAKVLVLAHLHSCSELFEEALDFMAGNAKAVCSRPDWMELIKKYPELAFQATQLMDGF